jgi:hypothetical protein
VKGLYGPSRIMSTDEALTVCRETGPPLLIDGKPVQRPTQSFQLQCNVQPLTGFDLMRVPELDRHSERLVVYTNELSNPAQLNDRVVRNCLNYQVENVETWGCPPNGYQKLVIVRIDVGPNRASTTRNT